MSSNENRNPVAEDFLRQLRLDYDLSDKDFWYHAESDCWILYHDACMRIAYLAGVEFDKPEWISAGQNGHWAVVVSGTLDSRSTWTTGEASVETSFSPYLCAMAEKRGKDRLVLDLLGAYALGIKSDIEADDFPVPRSGYMTMLWLKCGNWVHRTIRSRLYRSSCSGRKALIGNG